MLSYESKFYKQGYTLIAGIDEVGRGPLAGPVVAAAVIMPQNLQITGVTDSKAVSGKNRIILADKIKDAAIAWALGWVDQTVIDEINILQATYAAMTQALSNLQVVPDAVLIDGVQGKYHPGILCEFIIKGDKLSHSIAAASILAKVARDAFMQEEHKKYPHYGFDTNKGYGTPKHKAALQIHGPCPLHRHSFAKGMYSC